MDVKEQMEVKEITDALDIFPTKLLLYTTSNQANKLVRALNKMRPGSATWICALRDEEVQLIKTWHPNSAKAKAWNNKIRFEDYGN